jgi:hypothetical protein
VESLRIVSLTANEDLYRFRLEAMPDLQCFIVRFSERSDSGRLEPKARQQAVVVELEEGIRCELFSSKACQNRAKC